MRACACACVPVPACACVRVAGVWAWACVRVGVCPRACGAGSDHSAVYKQAPRCRARRARRRLEQAQAGAGCRRRADHKQAMQYHCRAGDHAAGGRAGLQTANNPPAFRPLCSRRPSGQVYATAGRYTGQAGTGGSGQAADAGAAPGGLAAGRNEGRKKLIPLAPGGCRAGKAGGGWTGQDWAGRTAARSSTPAPSRRAGWRPGTAAAAGQITRSPSTTGKKAGQDWAADQTAGQPSGQITGQAGQPPRKSRQPGVDKGGESIIIRLTIYTFSWYDKNKKPARQAGTDHGRKGADIY